MSVDFFLLLEFHSILCCLILFHFVFFYGKFHDLGDVKWIVIMRSWPMTHGAITIRPAGGQPPAGLLAARGLAARGTLFVVSVTINS
jgi:hypothetical protein